MVSALNCATVRTLAPELALGVLDGAERAEALAHVESCARCQAFVAELTEAVDLMPLLVEEREPPAGFERRVIAHLFPTANARRWRIARLVAAAAALVALVVGAVTVLGGGDGGRAPVAGARATAEPLGGAMIGTSSNVHAGWVWVTDGREVMVTVDYAVAPGRYRVELRPSGAEAVTLGEMTVAGTHASWAGTSPSTIKSGASIAMVGADGVAVCQAALE